MADISTIKVGGTIYSLKDTEARAAVTALQTAVASSLIFKGIISSAAEITELTDYKIGWTYKANSDFYIEDIGFIENGDMLICTNSNSDYSSNDWSIVQNNVDIMIGASDSIDGIKGLVPAPSIGDQNKYLCGNGVWKKVSLQWGNFSDLI